MKRVIFVLPILAALSFSACSDFQRRPYRYTRVYAHQLAAREKTLSVPVASEPSGSAKKNMPPAPHAPEAAPNPVLPQ